MITIRANDIIAEPLAATRSTKEMSAAEQEYYFGSLVPEGTSGLVLMPLNNLDGGKHEFIYRHLKKWAARSNLNMYFLRVGSDISKKSEYRTKIGLRKEIAVAHRENVINIEVDAPNGNSRLAVLGSLNEEAGFTSLEALLNWIYSIVIVSELEIGQVAKKAEAWINNTEDSFLGFDFPRVFKDLETDNGSAVCRFFPEENGKPAALSMVFKTNSPNL